MGGPNGRIPIREKLRGYSVKVLQNERISPALLKLALRAPMAPMANFSTAENINVLKELRHFAIMFGSSRYPANSHRFIPYDVIRSERADFPRG